MQVTTPYGVLEGTEERNTYRYSGIPYAMAPTGKLRFRAPVPPAFRKGTIKADCFAKNPMQQAKKGRYTDCSEDCLYLNVWVPKGLEGPLPVVVFFPGGGYAAGGAGAKKPSGPVTYDGSLMAEEMRVLFVTVSYRLNLFGFLDLSSFDDRFERNLGVKDAVFALRWVKECIGSFGGDRDNVTLMGQSAGGGLVSALMMCKEAEDLYAKVILQSACFESFYTPEGACESGKKFLEYLGLSAGEAEKVTEKDYESLYEAAGKLNGFMMEKNITNCSFSPVVDGELIREYPTLSDLSEFSKPVLIGTTQEEGNLFSVMMKLGKVDRNTTLKKLFAFLPEEKAGELLSSYPETEKESTGRAIGDVAFDFPRLRFAEHACHSGKVYMYRFDYAPFLLKLFGLRSCHISDLIPLFDLRNGFYGALRLFSEKDIRKVGKRMRQYWGSFARDGVPGAEGGQEWKPYEKENRFVMAIGKEEELLKNPDEELIGRYEGIDRITV